MGFTITTDGTTGTTQVPNDIILNYILKAGGEHVKIYLYLLMASQNPGLTGPVSVELLADRRDLTERDIVRMLRYWEREGLITLADDENGQITGLTLLRQPDLAPAGMAVPPVDAGKPVVTVPGSSAGMPDGYDEPSGAYGRTPTTEHPNLRVINTSPIPERTEYTDMQIDALVKDVEMRQTLNNVERCLGAPITPAHMQLVMYMICDLGFPGELVSYLYETGARRQKTAPRYLETIAIDWAKKGILSVAAARAEVADYSGKYRPIQNALGLHRDFAPAEKEIIDGWDAYQFPEEILVEACKRTVLQSGDTNLNYVSKILAGWSRQEVKTLADIRKVDEAFHKNKKTRPPSASARKRMGSNAFQNFRGRDYSDEDYEAMERQLLQRRGTP